MLRLFIDPSHCVSQESKKERSLMKGLMSFATGIYGIGIMAIASVFVYNDLRSRYKRRKILKSCSSTFPEPKFLRAEDYVDRDSERERLKEFLKRKPDGFYYMIAGPYGCGKSTLMHDAVMELKKEGVRGVHMIVAREKVPIAFAIARAFGLNRKSLINRIKNSGLAQFVAGEMTLDDWCSYVERKTPIVVLGEKLADLRTELGDGRVLTLVIDSVNNLVPYELDQLQYLAKVLADSGHIRMIFLDASGSALDIMKKNSSASRMVVLHAEDVSEEKAKDFLERKLKGTKCDARSAHAELTGNRLLLMRRLAGLCSSFTEERSREDIYKDFLLTYAGQRLEKCGIKRKPPPDTDATSHWEKKEAKAIESKWNLVSALVNAPERGIDLGDVQVGVVSELLKENVLLKLPTGNFKLHNQALITFLKKANKCDDDDSKSNNQAPFNLLK